MTASEIHDALSGWHQLQRYITDATEKDCEKLMEAEMNGARRIRMLLRIHSRYNKVRAHRERLDLKKKVTS